MKLYSKKLRSLAEIERERRRLVKEKELLEADGLIDVNEIIDGFSEMGTVAKAGMLPILSSVITKYVPFAAPFAPDIVAFAENWFLKKREKNNTSGQDTNTAGKVKSAIVTAGKDILFSYLKWKAIELSYKGVNKLWEKKKSAKQ
jgi:hypothetical protein